VRVVISRPRRKAYLVRETEEYRKTRNGILCLDLKDKSEIPKLQESNRANK